MEDIKIVVVLVVNNMFMPTKNGLTIFSRSKFMEILFVSCRAKRFSDKRRGPWLVAHWSRWDNDLEMALFFQAVWSLICFWLFFLHMYNSFLFC